MSLPERQVTSKERADAARRPRQLLQIHDSILIECPRDMAEQISTMLVETMEHIYPDLGVRLQVDVHTGNNWGEV